MVIFQKSSLETEKSELEIRIQQLEESVRLSQEDLLKQANIFNQKLKEAEDLVQVIKIEYFSTKFSVM
jgi:hypothetical protein